MSGPASTQGQPIVQEGAVDHNDLYVCAACCCTAHSLYCQYPDCCGIYTSAQVCCVETQGRMCKCVDSEKNFGR